MGPLGHRSQRAFASRLLTPGQSSRAGADAPPGDWQSYLDAFHEQRAGITEEVLSHSRDRDLSPYQWLMQVVPGDADVLDLACGSGPLQPLHLGAWVGLDASVSEIERARARGRGPLVRGDATLVPFGDRSFDVVVCSMALMLIQPLDAVLAEVARVLRPGGLLAALLPSTGPLSRGDRLRYARLLLALRRRLRYPNDGALADVASVLTRTGFTSTSTSTSDERRRFVYAVTTPEMAARFVESLYLPGEPPERIAALKVASGWVGKNVGVPLRRVIARVP